MSGIIAIYPGTFDPITYGHIDVIKRATKLFKSVIVAVAENSGKKPWFDLNERVKLAQTALSSITNVEVKGFNGLLTTFSEVNKAMVIVRSIRAVADFDYEFQLAAVNRRLAPTIETVFLAPAEEYAYISSSLVKEIASLGGGIEGFVPSIVKDALENILRKDG